MVSEREYLDEHGYVLLPRLLDDDCVRQMSQRVQALFELEGDRAGAEFKQEQGSRRLANLVAKGDLFWSLLTHPRVLPLVRHVLNDRVKLSSLNVRSVNAHWDSAQPLHCDMGAVPDALGYWVCNVVWMLDDFTPDNGPLRVVPGSHRWRRLPQEVLANPVDDHPQQTALTGLAGSAVVLNAHTWHGGMANQTDHPRTAIHAFYCRRDKPQQQYQKQLLSLELQQRLSADLRTLLAIDDPENDHTAQIQLPRSGFLP